MAKLHVSVSTTRKWWVMPLIYILYPFQRWVNVDKLAQFIAVNGFKHKVGE
jgi:hypothetical protein